MPAPLQSAKYSPASDSSTMRWGRTGEPGSAFNGFSKSNRGKNSGRGRGGRRAGGNSTAHDGANVTHPASPQIQKSDSKFKNSQHTSPPSPATLKTEKSSSSSLETPNHHPPVRTDWSSSRPVTSDESHGPKKPHSRGRRSNTSRNAGPPQSNHVLDAEPRLRRHQTRELPQTKNTSQPSAANTPNLQNPSSDIKSDIDALVERVRASAMANYRPGTPGSHIDWAGDDDNSLPDLNDWGVASPAPVGHTMISPIIMDGLTPLPELVSLAQGQVDTVVSASTKVPESVDLPQSLYCHRIQKVKEDIGSSVADEKQDGVTHPSGAESVLSPARIALHPSLPSKPASLIQHNGRHHDRSRRKASKKQAKSPKKATVELAEVGSRNESPVLPGGRASPRSPGQVQRQQSIEDELGLSASIHAPEQQETSRSRLDNAKSASQAYPPFHNKARSISHSRPHTIERSPSFHPTYITSSRDHARTQSASALTKNNGRSLHSRPVLTGDAISRLARTIGGSTAPTSK
ncbi:hypothetical protein AX15_004701 [Amanita polypyramis BW_CC]|nr:hypothetical protein AX15_004701 [Amanita polypyramis BW_CC]